MNKTSRVLLVSLLSVAVLAGCSKKVKEVPEAPVDTGSTTQPTGPSTSGLYGPGDLDTDACLRQRVVYFDLDQEDIKSEFQAIMAVLQELRSIRMKYWHSCRKNR